MISRSFNFSISSISASPKNQLLILRTTAWSSFMNSNRQACTRTKFSSRLNIPSMILTWDDRKSNAARLINEDSSSKDASKALITNALLLGSLSESLLILSRIRFFLSDSDTFSPRALLKYKKSSSYFCRLDVSDYCGIIISWVSILDLFQRFIKNL